MFAVVTILRRLLQLMRFQWFALPTAQLLFFGDSCVERDCGPLFRSSINPNPKPNLALTLLTLTITLTLTIGIADLRNSVPVPWSDLPSELKDGDISRIQFKSCQKTWLFDLAYYSYIADASVLKRRYINWYFWLIVWLVLNWWNAIALLQRSFSLTVEIRSHIFGQQDNSPSGGNFSVSWDWHRMRLFVTLSFKTRFKRSVHMHKTAKLSRFRHHCC